MWIAIWVCFAVFVSVFVGWTVLVLIQQKRAWAAFAKKHKLTYLPGKFMESPIVSGVLSGWRFSLSTGVQQTDDIRGQRFVTVIEFQLGRGMPTGGAIATKDYLGFINGLIFNEVFEPELAEWDKEHIVRARDKKNLQAYFNKERQQVLKNMFQMKNAAVLFFFDELEAVLRIETTDPLRNADHLEKIVKRLKSAVDVLAPDEREKRKFKKLLAEEKKRHEGNEYEYEDGYEDDEPAGEIEPEPVAKEAEEGGKRGIAGRERKKKNRQEPDGA